MFSNTHNFNWSNDLLLLNKITLAKGIIKATQKENKHSNFSIDAFLNSLFASFLKVTKALLPKGKFKYYRLLLLYFYVRTFRPSACVHWIWSSFSSKRVRKSSILEKSCSRNVKNQHHLFPLFTSLNCSSLAHKRAIDNGKKNWEE